jgi:hypothetical protein
MSTKNSTTMSAAGAVALDDLAHDVELLRIVEDQLGRLNSLKRSLRGRLKSRLEGHEFGTVNGLPVVRSWTDSRIIVVIDWLRERYPEQAEACEDIRPVQKFELLPAA